MMLFAFLMGMAQPLQDAPAMGIWSGKLNVGSTSLTLVLHQEIINTAFRASMRNGKLDGCMMPTCYFSPLLLARGTPIDKIDKGP